MNRKRNCGTAETINQLHGAFMEPSGPLGRTDADFVELEPDEELLCSVSDITEHLGRNITMVLETALSEIRKMVSIRIRVLKIELREKSQEIEALRARLDVVQKDGRECFSGAAAVAATTQPGTEAGFKKADLNKQNNTDTRRAKGAMSGIKKENINAICDYLMKDKNSRGSGDIDGEQSSHSSGGREARLEQESSQSLHLWADSGMTSVGSGHDESSQAATDDLFSMIPSSSKRMYEYEWITPMEYSAELKAMKDSVCENTLPSDADTDEDDDLLRREGSGLDQVQVSLAYHVQPPEFAMDPQNTSAVEVSPTKVKTEGSETGQNFTGKPHICSICGTLCPDSLFLEEHIKLIHTDSAQVLQALQSTAPSSSSSTLTSICNSSTESRKDTLVQNVDRSKSGDAAGITQEGSHVKKEIKLEGGYECGDCGRHFNYLGNLRQHQRIHTGEKPFMCPECGERFRHAARLKNHRLIHSGAESPYPCPQCGKGFSVLSGLKRHQRVHTGESPYACPQCGRRFKELGNLYTHQRIHSGATPYCCQNCGRSFRHLGTFKSHRCTPTL